MVGKWKVQESVQGLSATAFSYRDPGPSSPPSHRPRLSCTREVHIFTLLPFPGQGGGCHIIPGENTFEIKVVSKTYNCFYQRWDLERQRSGGYEKYAEHGYKTCVHSRK